MHNKMANVPVARGADETHKNDNDENVGPPLIVAAKEALNLLQVFLVKNATASAPLPTGCRHHPSGLLTFRAPAGSGEASASFRPRSEVRRELLAARADGGTGPGRCLGPSA